MLNDLRAFENDHKAYGDEGIDHALGKAGHDQLKKKGHRAGSFNRLDSKRRLDGFHPSVPVI